MVTARSTSRNTARIGVKDDIFRHVCDRFYAGCDWQELCQLDNTIKAVCRAKPGRRERKATTSKDVTRHVYAVDQTEWEEDSLSRSRTKDLETPHIENATCSHRHHYDIEWKIFEYRTWDGRGIQTRVVSVEEKGVPNWQSKLPNTSWDLRKCEFLISLQGWSIFSSPAILAGPALSRSKANGRRGIPSTQARCHR